MKIEKLPWYRRHTYNFLSQSPKGTTIHLSTEINMEKVIEHRKYLFDHKKQRLSYITYLIWATSRVLKNFPEANAGFHDGWTPRIVYYDRIFAKVTFDMTVANNKRIVVSQVIKDSDLKTLESIQETIDIYKKGALNSIPQLKMLRQFQQLPLFASRFIWRRINSNYEKKQVIQGSFTITSLGHRDILDFYPVISSTTCLGIGAIRERPIVENNKVCIKPIIKISFSVDHRVLDGALSADILSAIKDELEHFKGDQ